MNKPGVDNLHGHLVHTLPATTQALARGQISSDNADALVNATATTTPEVAARVEAAVLPRCPGRTYAETHRAATYRVTKWDVDAVRKRHQKAVDDRHVTTRSLGDGMAELSRASTIADIAAIWEGLTGLADAATAPGDSRTLGGRRVDTLVDLCTDILKGRLTTTDAVPQPHTRESPARRPRKSPNPTDLNPTASGAAARAAAAPAFHHAGKSLSRHHGRRPASRSSSP